MTEFVHATVRMGSEREPLNSISVVKAVNLTVEQFAQDYMAPGVPVLIEVRRDYV